LKVIEKAGNARRMGGKGFVNVREKRNYKKCGNWSFPKNSPIPACR
jgi:hypothetical protein